MKINRSITSLVLSLVMITTTASPVLAAVTHTVQAGESLFSIGQKYGTNVAQIKSNNGLKRDIIVPGQKLKIDNKTYTVKKGDTLTTIAKKIGTTVSALKTANGLKGDAIYPGQSLREPIVSVPSRAQIYSVSNDDLYWLARAVYGEARGESYQGQVAVAAVILNRVESGEFPNTIKDVIFEPLAFTCVADKQIYMEPNAAAIKAAREALAGTDPSGGALYYWNPVKATSKWVWSRPIIKRIGNHVFAV